MYFMADTSSATCLTQDKVFRFVLCPSCLLFTLTQMRHLIEILNQAPFPSEMWVQTTHRCHHVDQAGGCLGNPWELL